MRFAAKCNLTDGAAKVIAQVLTGNPASSVRGPKHKVKKSKTPILASDEARTLLDPMEC
jgi:hypothetical protein